MYEAVRPGPHGFSKRVALKRIIPALCGDQAFVRMFIDEARLAASLEHPNIVQVFDFGEDNGELFLAMELVDGTTVSRILRGVASAGDAVPLGAALHIAGQCARALAYAHDACDPDGRPLNVVHRDVSPANLLVTRTGHVKLADFGIARAVIRKQKTATGNLRGKLGYMSPEQVRNKHLDARSDVFSLSIILAEMLLGETLFSRGTDLEILMRIRDADIGVLANTSRHIPSVVRKLLLSGLSRHPQTRPQARVFADAVDSILRRTGKATGGPERLARLLFEYGLLAERPEDRAALEPRPRPTALFDWDSGSHDSHRPRVEQGRVQFDFSEHASYVMALDDGERTAPMPFPELARLTATGTVHAETPISRNGQPFVMAADHAELGRFFSTPALQWRQEEIASPRLKGDLRAAILLPLIHSLAVHRENGMLYLDDGQRRKKIYFVDGRPDFIASTTRQEMLGEYLVNAGRCLPMEMDMALAVLPRHAGRLGDALVSLGVVRPLELYRTVADQVRARYLEAFRWRSGHWLYVRGASSGEQTYPLGPDTYVLMRDATMELHPSELDAALAPLWEKVLRPAEASPASLSAYQVPDEWRWVLAQAKANATVGSVFTRTISQEGIDAEDALRALFLGISCQLVEAR